MKIALMPTVFLNWRLESTHITLISLAKKLKKEGHSVYVISPGEKGFPKCESFDGIPIHRGPTLSFSKFLNSIISPSLKLRELRRKGIKFDIIHSFSSARFFVLRDILAKWLSGNKRVKTIHTLRGYSRFRLGNMFSRLLNLSDLITVPTKVFANKLIKNGCKKNKVRIVRSHVNIKKFKLRDKQKAKKKIGIKENFVLYYGILVENRGPYLLMKAMKEVFKKFKNWKLVIVIRYKIPKEDKKLITKLGIEKNVILIGKAVDNIEDYVNAADIVALPYKDLIAIEGTPSCLLESMVCKIPVITTDLPELREIFSPGKDAIMLKKIDIDSLTKGINKLINDKNLRKKLGENGYKKAQQFSDEKIAKQFIRLYEELSNGS